MTKSAPRTAATRRRRTPTEVVEAPSPAGPRTETVTAIERAADVLALFAQAGPTLGVTEIAQTLGLSKTVVYRVLASFRAKGFVDFDERTRRYSMGPMVLTLGLTYLDRIDVRGLAREAMQRLSDQTNETATLSVRSGWTRVYIDQVTPPRDIKMVVPLGRPFPLHAGGSSKALLAFLTREEQEAYLEMPLDRLTSLTVTDPDQLRKELALVRQRGYAVTMGERQSGAGAVAAPVLGLEGRPVAAMSICGPVERFRDDVDAAAGLLLETTRSISKQMGYTGH
jgi:IclR family acetate operon transcriptional repressor